MLINHRLADSARRARTARASGPARRGHSDDGHRARVGSDDRAGRPDRGDRRMDPAPPVRPDLEPRSATSGGGLELPPNPVRQATRSSCDCLARRGCGPVRDRRPDGRARARRRPGGRVRPSHGNELLRPRRCSHGSTGRGGRRVGNIVEASSVAETLVCSEPFGQRRLRAWVAAVYNHITSTRPRR
jgi:hypothetical protein